MIVDVSGYYSAPGGSGSQFSAEAAPVRICDTRAPSPASPANQCSSQPIASGAPLTMNVRGLAGVPAGATAVVVNLTGIQHHLAHLSHRVPRANDSLLFRPQSRRRRGTGQLGGGDGQPGHRANLDPQRRRYRRRRGRCARVVFVGHLDGGVSAVALRRVRETAQASRDRPDRSAPSRRTGFPVRLALRAPSLASCTKKGRMAQLVILPIFSLGRVNLYEGHGAEGTS